ncbi:uncharacterized protein LOC115918191 [Strongylocentrotus purpuratus]|uniref:SET domain-containing protein n=1 Tax=Strongylocentrotus purpuratus TaxID=7668 RepID=A0A7M7PC63_STRPU|nr:uncharacterized protein LOC115918191 [Strongylocentrotus purpuratus]XP_030848967.1 uncharacterized protein LOC115918191 [Strongylocentrotus purpuratus]
MKKVAFDNNSPHLCLFALVDLKEGVELAYDYGVKNLPWRQPSLEKEQNIPSSPSLEKEKTILSLSSQMRGMDLLGLWSQKVAILLQKGQKRNALPGQQHNTML